MTIPVISVDEEIIGDLIDVMKWAEECMATKEPVTPHQVSEAAEEAGRRMGYESFRYTEAS